jgi:hypothetical protein
MEGMIFMHWNGAVPFVYVHQFIFVKAALNARIDIIIDIIQ